MVELYMFALLVHVRLVLRVLVLLTKILNFALNVPMVVPPIFAVLENTNPVLFALDCL